MNLNFLIFKVFIVVVVVVMGNVSSILEVIITQFSIIFVHYVPKTNALISTNQILSFLHSSIFFSYSRSSFSDAVGQTSQAAATWQGICCHGL